MYVESFLQARGLDTKELSWDTMIYLFQNIYPEREKERQRKMKLYDTWNHAAKPLW